MACNALRSFSSYALVFWLWMERIPMTREPLRSGTIINESRQQFLSVRGGAEILRRFLAQNLIPRLGSRRAGSGWWDFSSLFRMRNLRRLAPDAFHAQDGINLVLVRGVQIERAGVPSENIAGGFHDDLRGFLGGDGGT